VPFYRAGFGCALGTGRQWLSWIGLEDAVGAIRFALGEAGLSGPVNVVSPTSVMNAVFTRALGRIFGRQLPMAVPRIALEMMYGPITDEVLLASAHVVPQSSCGQAIRSGIRTSRTPCTRRLRWRRARADGQKHAFHRGGLPYGRPSYGENPHHL
jgi:NAD dependent epimerase/dehydratase family enzyme